MFLHLIKYLLNDIIIFKKTIGEGDETLRFIH
jgi:hypothetical protein